MRPLCEQVARVELRGDAMREYTDIGEGALLVWESDGWTERTVVWNPTRDATLFRRSDVIQAVTAGGCVVTLSTRGDDEVVKVYDASMRKVRQFATRECVLRADGASVFMVERGDVCELDALCEKKRVGRCAAPCLAIFGHLALQYAEGVYSIVDYATQTTVFSTRHAFRNKCGRFAVFDGVTIYDTRTNETHTLDVEMQDACAAADGVLLCTASHLVHWAPGGVRRQAASGARKLCSMREPTMFLCEFDDNSLRMLRLH